MKSVRRTLGSAPCLAAVVAFGCGTGSPPAEGDGAAVAESASIAVGQSAADPTVTRSDGIPGGAEARPFRNFSLPGEPRSAAERIRYPVRIESAIALPVVVHATAGGDSVLLDTLPASGALRLDLEAPPAGLRLVWRTTDGRWSGELPVPAVADTVQLLRLRSQEEVSRPPR